jgi:hypothetical protein
MTDVPLFNTPGSYPIHTLLWYNFRNLRVSHSTKIRDTPFRSLLHQHTLTFYDTLFPVLFPVLLRTYVPGLVRSGIYTIPHRATYLV